ncbi:MAG: hypothetical protein HYZ28_21855 [Myxococcales bacterium]|nr:hypothetical protein [Myxococcales bacterium]
MARARKTPTAFELPGLLAWAESVGEALGRGVARGINAGLSAVGVLGATPRRRGRPPKQVPFAVPPERRCRVEGCGRPSRSKGLCSAHYQAERRRTLAKR